MVFDTKISARKVVRFLVRTQTKIKNYFYGNIRYALKVIVKYFMKSSTGFLNDINTETLVNIYESEEGYFRAI